MAVRTDSNLEPYTGTWLLDPDLTRITFQARLLLVIRAAGTVRAISGEAEVAPSGEGTGRLIIDPGSVDTGNAKRDAHLRSSDLFDVASYPEIVFTATSATMVAADQIEVNGHVVVQERTTPLTLSGTVTVKGNSATLIATVPVGKRILGIKKLNLAKAKIHVSARFVRTGTAATTA